MTEESKAKVAFVATTMGAFDAVLDVQEIRRMDQYSPLIARLLEGIRPSAQVIDLGIAGNDREATVLRDKVASAGCDLLLIWPLNYTLDSLVLHLVHGLRLPLLLLNSMPEATFPADFNFAGIMENSTVSCIPTITNVLCKNHVPFTLVSGALEDPSVYAEIALYASAARTVRALRNSKVGMIGHSYPGISALSVDQAAVTGHFGVELVAISVPEIIREYQAVSDEEVRRLASQVQASCQISDITFQEIADSVRFEPALKRLAARYGINALASLCQDLIITDALGIAPCHAHTVLAGMGIPVTCECDLATAVTLLILRQLTDEVIFLEFYTQDFARGVGMFSHCGQGNLRLARGGVTVKPHPCYPAARGRGIAYEYVAKEGDATIACLTYLDGRWRMVAARIECLSHPKLPSSTAQVYFKFKNQDFNHAYRRWCELGGISHLGIAYGDHMQALKTACRYLDVDFCVAA
jgi:L-arabinose isomerase